MSRIVLLHGASSSGKTTLAHAIRAASPEPWMFLSFDTFRDHGGLVPADYRDWTVRRARAFQALHQSFAAFADAGFDLIIEHILDTDGWHTDLQSRLAGHAILFVGVHTSEDVLARREAARGDRRIGSAIEDSRRVHTGLTYDLEVDGTVNALANAFTVLSAKPSVTSAFFQKPSLR